MIKMFCSKIIIVKGLTKEDREQKKWVRVEYTLEMVLREGENPELAKQYADTLLSAWLKEAKQPQQKQVNEPSIGKKICAFEGCSKEIDPKYSFCYNHFKRVTRR